LGVVTKLDEQLGLVCFEHGEALGGVLPLLELAELLPDAGPDVSQNRSLTRDEQLH
jgi:hypothetical protein